MSPSPVGVYQRGDLHLEYDWLGTTTLDRAPDGASLALSLEEVRWLAMALPALLSRIDRPVLGGERPERETAAHAPAERAQEALEFEGEKT